MRAVIIGMIRLSTGPAPQEAAQGAEAAPDSRLSAVYLGRFGQSMQATCDTNLLVEDVLLPCHKIQLAAVSSGLTFCKSYMTLLQLLT